LKFRRRLKDQRLGTTRFAKAGEVDEVQHGKNRNKSRIRAWLEQVFAVFKRLRRFSKVRRFMPSISHRAAMALQA
jgi:transposase, IS5 family